MNDTNNTVVDDAAIIFGSSFVRVETTEDKEETTTKVKKLS